MSLCECGCGQDAGRYSPRSHRTDRGEFCRFLPGHHPRGGRRSCEPELNWELADDGCWLWAGYCKPEGYGMVRVNYKAFRAHRWMFELLEGPIPEGLVLDHLCRNRACVNPDHLEPVTAAENARRAHAVMRANRKAVAA